MTFVRNTEAPLFVNDCADCVFLGTSGAHDLYFCTQHGWPTVLARYGSKGAEYTSGLALADYVPVLAEARSRAVAAGLLPTP